jgi:hypothetical protein
MFKVVHTFALKLAINKTTNSDLWKDGDEVMEIQYFFERISVFSLAVVNSIEGPDARYAGQLRSLEQGTVASRLHGVTLQNTEFS